MHRIVLGFVVALGLAWAGAAQAQSMRIPKTGDPALVLDVPTSWTAKYDDIGNLQFSSPDHSLNLQLSVINDPAVQGQSLAQVATDIFKQGQIDPFYHSESASIAGRPGQAFFARKSYGNRGTVDFMVVLVKLDGNHILSSGRVTRHGLTATQLAPVNEMMRRVRIVGAR